MLQLTPSILKHHVDNIRRRVKQKRQPIWLSQAPRKYLHCMPSAYTLYTPASSAGRQAPYARLTLLTAASLLVVSDPYKSRRSCSSSLLSRHGVMTNCVRGESIVRRCHAEPFKSRTSTRQVTVHRLRRSIRQSLDARCEWCQAHVSSCIVEQICFVAHLRYRYGNGARFSDVPTLLRQPPYSGTFTSPPPEHSNFVVPIILRGIQSR
jgi:hypothetical protein